jgi:hypothetical protein
MSYGWRVDDLTVESTAAVATDRPGRYAKQLVAHLSRRTSGEWNDEPGTGWIHFEAAEAELRSGDGVLHLLVRTTPEQLDRFEDVVGRHLVRFGARDELVVQWARADGSPGTEQRRTDDQLGGDDEGA